MTHLLTQDYNGQMFYGLIILTICYEHCIASQSYWITGHNHATHIWETAVVLCGLLNLAMLLSIF